MNIGTQNKISDLSSNVKIDLTKPFGIKVKKDVVEIINKWGVVLPKESEPLLLDFGLKDFFKNGLVEYWITNDVDGGYCGKYLFVFDGQTCPLHYHIKKHETFFVVKGEIDVNCGDKKFKLNEGESLAVNREVLHSFAGIGPALILELSQVCYIGDSHFQDENITLSMQ